MPSRQVGSVQLATLVVVLVLLVMEPVRFYLETSVYPAHTAEAFAMQQQTLVARWTTTDENGQETHHEVHTPPEPDDTGTDQVDRHIQAVRDYKAAWAAAMGG